VGAWGNKAHLDPHRQSRFLRPDLPHLGQTALLSLRLAATVRPAARIGRCCQTSRQLGRPHQRQEDRQTRAQAQLQRRQAHSIRRQSHPQVAAPPCQRQTEKCRQQRRRRRHRRRSAAPDQTLAPTCRNLPDQTGLCPLARIDPIPLAQVDRMFRFRTWTRLPERYWAPLLPCRRQARCSTDPPHCWRAAVTHQA
jgi:hypothetical protein